MEQERKMAAGEFKAICLSLMDQVKETGQPILITKRDVPVARLVPIEEEPRPLFGRLKGTIRFHGDITKPIDEEWDANR